MGGAIRNTDVWIFINYKKFLPFQNFEIVIMGISEEF